MADMNGYQFSPDLASRFRTSLNNPTGGVLPQGASQALQVLSLHLPAFLGGSPIAPDALLRPRVGGVGPASAVQAQTTGFPSATPVPSTPTGAPPATPFGQPQTDQGPPTTAPDFSGAPPPSFVFHGNVPNLPPAMTPDTSGLQGLLQNIFGRPDERQQV